MVTRQKRLFQLPTKKNVDVVIEEYANCRRAQGNADNEAFAVNEAVGGRRAFHCDAGHSAAP